MTSGFPDFPGCTPSCRCKGVPPSSDCARCTGHCRSLSSHGHGTAAAASCRAAAATAAARHASLAHGRVHLSTISLVHLASLSESTLARE